MPQPAPIEVATVALAVRDLAALTGFYRDAIGLTVIDTADDAIWLGADGHRLIELRRRPDLKPVDPASAGLFHTAFLLPTRADLGRWLQHAAATHVPLTGAADHLVSEAVYLSDPEGNGIEIYADRPRAEWRWEGDQIVMANDRLDRSGLVALADQPWAGAPPGTRIGHLHLQVGDVAQAESFYAGTLGLGVTLRWPKAVFFGTGGYHHDLAVNVWNSYGAPRREPDRAGLAEVTLRSAAPRDPVTDPWGTIFTFTDRETA